MKSISDFLNHEYKLYSTDIRDNYPEIHYNRYKTIKNAIKNEKYAPFQWVGAGLIFLMNLFIGICILINLNLTSNLAQIATVALSAIATVPLFKLTYMFRVKFGGKRKSLIENEINDGFMNKKISEEMHNKIKLELSMDEYKMLCISYNKNMDFTYLDIIHFIKDKENIDKNFKNIEESKNCITLSEEELSLYNSK